MEMTYASRGVANAGLATAIGAAILSVLNSVGGIGAMALARQDIATVRDSLTEKIKLEAERRCCGDNSIASYANATFYPKMVADVTTGTATTAQTLYNPLPKCGECCNGN